MQATDKILLAAITSLVIFSKFDKMPFLSPRNISLNNNESRLFRHSAVIKRIVRSENEKIPNKVSERLCMAIAEKAKDANAAAPRIASPPPIMISLDGIAVILYLPKYSQAFL